MANWFHSFFVSALFAAVCFYPQSYAFATERQPFIGHSVENNGMEIDTKYDKYVNEAYDDDIIRLVGDNTLSYATPDNGYLSGTTIQLLESIPANGLPTFTESLAPKESFSIKKGESSNPFPAENSEQDPNLRNTLGLHVSVKKLDTSVFDNMKTAHEALSAGQTESAVVYYKKILHVEPNNKDALFGLATTYHKTGQFNQARDTYIKLITLDQNHWPALNNFLILASEEAPEDALNQLKKLQESNPEFAPIPAQMGLIYIQQKNYKQAIKNLGRAVVLEPENMSYRYNLALTLEHVGGLDIAAKLYKQILVAGKRGQDIPASNSQIQNRLRILASKKAAQ